MQSDSDTEEDSSKFIYPLTVVKPEDLQDLKQEAADEYNYEVPCFTIKVIIICLRYILNYE